MTTPPNIAALAGSLTGAQRELLRSPSAQGNMMGGWFGVVHEHPDLVEKTGIDHPVFGPHYRLTPLGQQIAAYLKEQSHDGQG